MKEDLAIAALAGLIFLGSIITAHEVGWSRATKSATAAAKAREARIDADHAEALTVANQRERDAERNAGTDLAAQAATHKEEIENERKKRERFVADVRSGAVRLSIPIVGGGSHCTAGTGTDSAAASGDRIEARAELAPEAGLALAAIADDGNDAIRQLNRVIDAYETVRARYNALNDAQAR